MYVPESTSPAPFDNYTRETEAMILTEMITPDEKPEWEWIWPGYLPVGGLTLLTGDDSIGKTHLALDLAARVSAGLPMPDGSPCSPGRVLLIMLDDDMYATVPFLLENAGAKTDNISTLHCMWSDEKEAADPNSDCLDYFSFSDRDFRHLEKTLKAVRPRLMIIDPLFSLLDNTPSMSKRDLGLWLKRLKETCLAFKTACLLTTQRPVSGALCNPTGLERSPLPIKHAHTVLLATSHPSRPDVAFLANARQRLSQRSPTWLYSIVNPSARQGYSRVCWHGLSPLTHADLLRPHLTPTQPYSQRRQRILTLLRDAYPEALDAVAIANMLNIVDDPTQIASISKMLQRLEDFGELSKTARGLYQASTPPLLSSSHSHEVVPPLASQSTSEADSCQIEPACSTPTQRDSASPLGQVLPASGPEQLPTLLSHQAPPVPIPALALPVPSPPPESTHSNLSSALSPPSAPLTPGPVGKKSSLTKKEQQARTTAPAAHQKSPKYKRKNTFHSVVKKLATTPVYGDADPPPSDAAHPTRFDALPASYPLSADKQKKPVESVQNVQTHKHSSIHPDHI